MDTSRLIRPLDFCQIVSDKFAEDVGVKRGHIVYVAGLKALPESEADPYTQRIKFFVHLVSHGGHIDASKLYLVDPKSLDKVSKSKQKKLTDLAKADYDEKPHRKMKAPQSKLGEPQKKFEDTFKAVDLFKEKYHFLDSTD